MESHGFTRNWYETGTKLEKHLVWNRSEIKCWRKTARPLFCGHKSVLQVTWLQVTFNAGLQVIRPKYLTDGRARDPKRGQKANDSSGVLLVILVRVEGNAHGGPRRRMRRDVGVDHLECNHLHGAMQTTIHNG